MISLTIASLNTFGVTLNPYDLVLRYRAIADHFNTSSVEVLQFQEVFTYFHLTVFKHFLRTYPYSQYHPTYFGPKGGLVTFSRIPLGEREYVTFSKKYMPFGLSMLELLVQKGMLITRLKNLPVSLVNTHLTAAINQDWSKESKYSRKLYSEVSQFQKVLKGLSERVVIASGDFNIAKASKLYRRMFNLRLLYNPFENDNLPTRHQVFVSAGRKPNCIDYILIYGNKNRYVVNSRERIFTNKTNLGGSKIGYATDHIGLQISLKVK